MNRLFLAVLIAAPLVGCGDSPDQSVNPSDAATLATGAAVVQEQIEDDDSSSNSNPGFNNFFSNSSSNDPNNDPSNTSNNSDGVDPFDLDCTGALILSGGASRSEMASGCGGGSSGDTQSIAWTFGALDWLLRFEDTPIRGADDRSSFETVVVTGPAVSEIETAYRTTCTVNLVTATGYTDRSQRTRSVWVGSLDCPDLATPIERSGPTEEWMEVAGDPVQIESFRFETPYPRAN